MGLHTHWWLKQ